MEMYIIPPLAHPELMDLGDRYFCLAHHYLQNESYANHFKELRKKEGVFITLDNGAAEHSLVTEDILLGIVSELEPDEVISPDVLFDKDQTLANLDSFILKMFQRGLFEKTKLFGCPQGENEDEWLECYIQMLNNPNISVIGLSKIAVPKCFLNKKNDEGIKEARHKCIKYLSDNDLIRKPIHFLGMGNPTEFTIYDNPFLRSTDSCYTVLAAINDVDFSTGNFKRIPTTNDYFERKLTEDDIVKVKKNVAFLREQLNKG